MLSTQFHFGRKLLISASVFCVIWTIAVTTICLIFPDELLDVLERYASPDGVIEVPRSQLFVLLVGPGFIPIVFFATFREWVFPLKYLPLYFGLFVVHFAVFTYYQNVVAVNSVKEDGMFETGTAVLALIAFLIFFTAGILGSRISFALGIAWLIFGLEEISWGQRIFGITPPEFFIQYNYQQEVNLHNFFNFIGVWTYLVFNFCLFCFFSWFRKAKVLSNLYKLNGISDLLSVSDKFGLWMVPLLLLFLSIYPGNEFVEEQWAIFGVLLSSLNLLQLIENKKYFF